MQMPDEDILPLNIKELLGGADKYEIPVYQRNYAWEAKEIEQLIQDIMDYSTIHKNNNYYIGTLVVSDDKQNTALTYSTIDGQQRLTTLSILSSVLKNEYGTLVDMSWFTELNLWFASREKSRKSLDAAFKGAFTDDNYEENIRAAYKICKEELSKRMNLKNANEKIDIKEFANYLYTYVKILRVKLPKGLDLNHYFEIMNSRGEQLEKHEVLKAELMECFNDNSVTPAERKRLDACFNLIWEACSNMEKYVQYGFTPDQRHIIFGANDWSQLVVFGFDDFVERIAPTLQAENSGKDLGIDAIISGDLQPEKKEESEESPDRFNAVVNFQNFLLHVLRVQVAKDEVALDDKRLIDLFKSQLPKDKIERISFVKQFIYNLLRCKFLFDNYVIKREFTANTDRWSLKRLKWYKPTKAKNGVTYTNTFGAEEGESYDSDNRKVLMLLSMFHTSIPSMSYKYWLNAALNYLFNQFEINSRDYIKYLEHIAKSFVFDRYLAVKPSNYYELIFEIETATQRSIEQLDIYKLNYGALENNLIFNFVDYLLWLKYKDTEKDNRVKTFEYKFRSSVEHFYPQNPIGGGKLNETKLHSFGNLCLISHADNSKYSNYLPDAKSTHYNNKVDIDSLKQFLMIKQCMASRNWVETEISNHEKAMIDLLEENLYSNYKPNTEISLAQKWFKEYQVKDRNLLVRALLCFGDCAKYISGDKYNLFDFDYIRNHEAYIKFEEFIENESPKNLEEIISRKLVTTQLKESYQYLFAKYPSVIEYCEAGNFLWYEQSDGRLIYLLESEKRTENKAKELITFIVQGRLENLIETKLYTNYESLIINIGYSDQGYYICNDENSELLLHIRNEDGTAITYFIEPLVNGNSKSVKLLEELKWEKTEDGNFIRRGNQKLTSLQGNFEEMIQNTVDELNRLLKNGLQIVIQ